jgi:Fe-S-cluster-containing hydrogenase component 2
MALKKVAFQERAFPTQCSGCRICELVCSFTHYKIFNPTLSRIRVTSQEHELIDFPVTCRQCADPPCHEVCPTKALSRNESGANQIDREQCIGCGECVSACPFGAMYIPAGEKLPISCDLCGGDPQCVKYCPREVLFYATDEQVAKIKRGKLDPSQMSTQEEESSK